MTSHEIRENLKEVRINIKTVRKSRNHCAFLTGAWTLNTGLIAGGSYYLHTVDVPNTLFVVIAAASGVITIAYGCGWYSKQQELTELKDEKEYLEHEELKQLTLRR